MKEISFIEVFKEFIKNPIKYFNLLKQVREIENDFIEVLKKDVKRKEVREVEINLQIKYNISKELLKDYKYGKTKLSSKKYKEFLNQWRKENNKLYF